MGPLAVVATHSAMSSTVLRDGEYRFYFHVLCPGGEAKFWLEPRIELAQSCDLNERKLRIARALVEDHADEFRGAWRRHFGG